MISTWQFKIKTFEVGQFNNLNSYSWFDSIALFSEHWLHFPNEKKQDSRIDYFMLLQGLQDLSNSCECLVVAILL